jgi:stage II sporulation protein D
LPSNNYRISESEGGVELQGRGHGHGLGYCQRGGAGMARAGANAREIIEHYFPGAAVTALR